MTIMQDCTFYKSSNEELQAAIDALPPEGGKIIFSGCAFVSALDLSEKHDIQIVGSTGEEK